MVSKSAVQNLVFRLQSSRPRSMPKTVLPANRPAMLVFDQLRLGSGNSSG